MIDDGVFDVYLVLARIPADQWAAQCAIRDFCVRNDTYHRRGRNFVLWFETDSDGADELRHGIVPIRSRGGPIFYGWAMLSDGKGFAKDVRRIIEQSGCTQLVMDRWRK